MGREGVAYTFVTPEEGSELTRIEMRIDRLLKRYEVPGFDLGGRPEAKPEAATTTATGEPIEAEPPKEPSGSALWPWRPSDTPLSSRAVIYPQMDADEHGMDGKRGLSTEKVCLMSFTSERRFQILGLQCELQTIVTT